MNNKIDKLIIELINIQYKLANVDKTYENALKDKNWFINDVIDETIYYNNFKPIAVSKIKKTLKCSDKYAENQFGWFTLNYGLKFN